MWKREEMKENIKRKKKEKKVGNGKIVIFKIGTFNTAIGKEAVMLNKKIGLKLRCIKKCVKLDFQ